MASIDTLIGPTFGAEVLASPCAGWPFSWGEDGVHWADDALDDGQVAELTALVEAHDPSATLPRQASGKQIGEALAADGLLDAWDNAVDLAKAEDRYYWFAGYREMMPEDNPKLQRIAGLAKVELGPLFDKALEEPTT